ncbi:MAG: hypothetical protein JNN30_10725 [Rhodanobacteraceae bacterium]|nr:hypothetical protein [Rhodanobacteraceae bacterium]
MSVYRLISSSTLVPKFAAVCAAATGFAVVGLFFGQHHSAPTVAPQPLHVITLPTIVVVPSAADRAAAAALETAAVPAPGKRRDEA